MTKVLIYLDPFESKQGISLLAVAKKMFPNTEYQTYAIRFCPVENSLISLFDVCISIDDPRINHFNTENLTRYIQAIHKKYVFQVMLFPTTVIGRMLAPRVAMKLQAGLVADVTQVKHNNGQIELVRPAFDGKLLASIVPINSKIVMATIRAHMFDDQNPDMKKVKHISFYLDQPLDESIQVLSCKPKKPTNDIRNSSILVSGGGGVADDFYKIQHLADQLGGMIAASRSIVDRGIASREIQVGQSGNIVNPKLYIALGIYGTLQHLEGLKNQPYLICVNKNPNAPICSLADIVVQGDALEFVDRMVDCIKKHQKE